MRIPDLKDHPDQIAIDWSYASIRDRPTCKSGNSTADWFLPDEVHDVLTDNDIKYSLEYFVNLDESGWYIVFDNKRDAILFKLIWE
jgi:hypothetical protein